MTFENGIRERLSAMTTPSTTPAPQSVTPDNAGQPNPNEEKKIVFDYTSKTADKEEPKTEDKKDPEPKPEEKKEEPAFDKEELKKFVPQARFNDIYAKMKTLEKRNLELEAKVKERTSKLSDEDKDYYNELRKTGMATPEETLMIQNDGQMKDLQEELQKEIEADISFMETNFTGENGLPKFEKEDVIKYGLENQIFNPKVAYKDKYFAEIVDHYVNETLKKKSQQPSFGGGGGKTPEITKPNFSIANDSGRTSMKDYLASKLKGITGVN